MVINHDKRWLYLSPPKTGSTALTCLLTDGDDWYTRTPALVRQFGGMKHRGQHCMDIPPGCVQYRTLVSVRNPFSRAVSLWWHWNCESRRPKSVRPPLEFDEFLRRVIASQDELHRHPLWIEEFYAFTISRWLKWVPRVDYVVRQESLEHDLNALNLAEPVVVPHRNRAPAIRGEGPVRARRQDWQAYYEPHTIDLVQKWAAADFERFGYSLSLVSGTLGERGDLP